MKAFLRRRGPTIAVAALMFVAGGATVTTAQNLITSADIQNGTIRTVDLADNAVTSRKIANGHVRRPDIANNAVNAPKITNGAVRRAKIANSAVNAPRIANGAVRRPKIASNAVDAARIADGAVRRPKIANNAVNAPKIANGSVKRAKIANNAVNSAKIASGSIQIGDLSAGAQDALTAFSGANWSVVDRNVRNGGDSDLRAGPSAGRIAPPLGVGSLGLRTGAATDKATFGNQTDFIGMLVSDLTALSYSVFTTDVNIAISPANLANIQFEIDPNLDGVASNFSTMSHVPPAQVPGWSAIDAVTEGQWFLTGPAGTATGCSQAGTLCTFPQLIAALTADDATDGSPAEIFTALVNKGTDFVFSGAVDALRINDTVYDFEPNGVFETPAGP